MGTIYTGDSVLLETVLPPPRQIETTGVSNSALGVVAVIVIGVILYFVFRGK